MIINNITIKTNHQIRIPILSSILFIKVIKPAEPLSSAPSIIIEILILLFHY